VLHAQLVSGVNEANAVDQLTGVVLVASGTRPE
jgi:hypothetical protein